MQLLGQKNENIHVYSTSQLQRRRVHMQKYKNLKEATQLIETGFKYVTEIEGSRLFRKRK